MLGPNGGNKRFSVRSDMKGLNGTGIAPAGIKPRLRICNDRYRDGIRGLSCHLQGLVQYKLSLCICLAHCSLR